MTRLAFLVLLAASCAAVVPLPAATPGHEHGKMGSGQAEFGASAAFDAKGMLWAVHKVSGHIAVSRSDNRGQSWSNPVLVTSAPEPTDAGGDARPKIALGSTGEVYLTWTKPLSKPYTGEIRFSRSVDGGRSFSAPFVAHRDPQEITHRFDTIAVNTRGQVFVAWIDKRDLAAAGDNPKAYRGAAVYFAVSDDRGVTFRGDYKLADHACECCRIALVPRADGAVTAMWRHIFAPNIRDHATAVMFGDGKSDPVRRASFEDWRIDACPHHGPGLAADASGGLHAVWFSAAPSQRGFYYGKLRDGGSDALRRIGAETAGQGDVAVSGERIAIVWKETVEGRTRLLGSVSRDGGKTWRDAELTSVSGPADRPAALAYQDRLYVFWNTREKPLFVAALGE